MSIPPLLVPQEFINLCPPSTDKSAIWDKLQRLARLNFQMLKDTWIESDSGRYPQLMFHGARVLPVEDTKALPSYLQMCLQLPLNEALNFLRLKKGHKDTLKKVNRLTTDHLLKHEIFLLKNGTFFVVKQGAILAASPGIKFCKEAGRGLYWHDTGVGLNIPHGGPFEHRLLIETKEIAESLLPYIRSIPLY